MIERRWGHIINMSPPLDVSMIPGRIAYAISKLGMNGFMMIGIKYDLPIVWNEEDVV